MENKQKIVDELSNVTDVVKIDEPLKKHTSFKIGGNAAVWVEPTSYSQLQNIINICKKYNVDYYIIGNGSNLLISDTGFDGIIISIYKNLSNIKVEGTKIIAQAGALLSKIATTASANGLSGFEFAHGIPGTLGGAVTMNAGAYDGEIKNVLSSVIVHTIEGEIKTLNSSELELGYRTSNIVKNGYIVLEATIDLEIKENTAITDKMKDFSNRRKEKQPLNYPSAGSTFKRPEGNFAGKLIMDSGLSGFTIGGAQVSSKHCGFVINIGDATAQDVIDLIEHVKKTVNDKYQVELEPEIKFVGDF
ncbi:MAG: UDP-N-acetylenolpyruvoylglucosamine reductase [Epulopiscium sp. Nele67-Bin004]|nr:MAG: UDP-N-acetylenolpyruvoylglucosamine reductase [Epulopiscium sp. Nele67-Bin004]